MITENQERDEMAKRLSEHPDEFYRRILLGMPFENPAAEVGSLLGLATSTINKWSRPRETGDDPTATGARSDYERHLLFLRHIAVKYDIEEAQRSVDAQQRIIDEERARRVKALVSEIKDEGIREAAIKEISGGKRVVLEGGQVR